MYNIESPFFFFSFHVLDSILNRGAKRGVNETNDTLKSGHVVPAYGHGMLPKPDPRFEALMDFADSRPDVLANPVFQLVKKNSEIAPGVLRDHGKTKNPHPNVDAASGVLFHHYGFHQPLYYKVTFGVSRALGLLAQLVWDRALGLPFERPKSINVLGLKKWIYRRYQQYHDCVCKACL